MEFTRFLIILVPFIVGTLAAKPQPPEYSIASSASDSITLSITAPSISDLKGYRMQYSEVGGKKKQVDVGKETEYIVEGLSPSTPYRFRIQTKSRSGSSKYGSWVNGATVADAPPPTEPPPEPPAPLIPEPPQNLAVDPMTTSAAVTWTPPVDNGAVITGYRLTYGTVDNPAANTVDLDPSPTQTQLDGLVDNTQYSVSLIAFNTHGESPPVSASFQTPEEKLPPPPVENIQSTPSETSVEVTWTLPATTTANAIEGITVIFGEEGASPETLQTSNFESNTATFTAEGLAPGTRYTLAVFTVNQQGQSEPVAVTAETIMSLPDPTEPPPPPPTTTQPPDVAALIPEMPRNLRATSVTEISARLIWEKPVDNGAELRGYVLAYGPMTDPTANTQQLNTSPTQFDLYGLQTNIQYSVYITAYNQDGQSNPAEIEFWTSSGRTPPPPVEEVQSYPTENTVYITWTLPQTDGSNGIETIRLGFGPYGTSVDYLPFLNLDGGAQSYTAQRLAPGTSYTVGIITQNSEGDSDPVMLTVQTHRPVPVATRPPPPDRGYEGNTPPAPVELTARVVSPTTIEVDFTDPTLQGRTDIRDERYYRLRYKKEEDRNFQYMNIRQTPYTLEFLTPESNYQIDVKTVINREAESSFTDATFAFTGENIVRDVTAIQLLVTGPGRVDAIINWMPPDNQPRPITGYALEYAAGYYVTSRSEFARVFVDNDVPKATLRDLAGDTTYHVRVAPRFGSGIGRFSDPPDAFLTPPIPVAGQPLYCGGPETPEQIEERVTWMRGRSGMIGVPLPYCDDYYGVHECHGSVCFCIPGSAPPGTKQCSGGGNQLYGDDPNSYATTAPCDAEYEATLEAIDLASKTGKPLIEARLPYCTRDGYYQSKQCLGSMCYCSTREGKHTGKEVPVWEAQTLVCSKPAAPKYTLESTTPTSFTIYITPPSSVPGLLGYKVHYQEIGSKKTQITIGDVTEYVINGLIPSSAYRVRIFTKARGGNGKFGKWVNVATMSDGPPPTERAPPVIPGSPQNLAADPTATSATVTWEAPVDNGAEITGYRLTYGTLDNPTSNTVNLNPSSTETQLDGLTDSTQYRVSLVALSVDSESAIIVVEFQTLEEKFPPPGVEILRSSTKENAIEVTWALPETTTANVIERIDVSFGEYGTPIEDLETSYFESNTVTFLTEGLSPVTRYTVVVVTVNQQGQSKPVITTVETLEPPPEPTTTPPPPPEPTAPKPPKIPEAPENLSANYVTEISTRLIWEKPTDNGADIVGYVVSYGPINDPTANMQTLNRSPTQFDLYGLERGTQYSVYITAYNRNGQSDPAELEFWTVSGKTSPPQVEEVKSYPQQSSIYFTWTLPRTSTRNEIENIRFGIGPYGTRLDYLPTINLGKDRRSYTAQGLAPGTYYTVAIFTENSVGDGEPVILSVETERPIQVATRPTPQDKGYEGHTPPAPVELTATVLDPNTIKINFVDPTIQGRNDVFDERYYRLRYKKEEDRSYQYMNVRETPYTLQYLTPEANYQIDVKTVINRHTQSPFTEKAYVFTGENIVRDVTAVQLLVTGPGRVKAIINWIPPENPKRQITGYEIEYTEGYYVTSRSVFKRILVDGTMPKGTIEGLAGDTTYHVRVAPRFGSGIGRFSDPPGAFLTPSVPVAGQPLTCDTTEGLESTDQIKERLTWMGDRAGMVGVPLPYCDDYYGIHECHGSICFCIPGKAPNGAKSCSRSGGAPGTRPHGDDPNADNTDAPCYEEYESAREAIEEASKTGKPLIEARLPYCTQDGYYQSKQCLGSMCYCSTREGKHTGKEVPIWEVQTLVCCKYNVMTLLLLCTFGTIIML